MTSISVYCDESRHTGGAGSRYCVIGSLWVPDDARPELQARLKSAKARNFIKSEVKWSKASRVSLQGYKELVDIFLDAPASYRAIVIDSEGRQDAVYHDGDEELGFYKFHYENLEKWLKAGNSYKILLDFKNNKRPGRTTELLRCLQNYGRVRNITIPSLNTIYSEESVTAQLCDLLTGATSADANNSEQSEAKSDLIAYLARRLDREELSGASGSPAISKFNVFRIRLRQQV